MTAAAKSAVQAPAAARELVGPDEPELGPGPGLELVPAPEPEPEPAPEPGLGPEHELELEQPFECEAAEKQLEKSGAPDGKQDALVLDYIVQVVEPIQVGG